MPVQLCSAGFEKFSFVEPARGREVKCAIWYPTASVESDLVEGPWNFRVAAGSNPMPGRCPLVVISHGTGSSWREHYDTAEFLARRGFVVDAPSHLGDSYDYGDKDFGGLESAIDRPGQVSHLLDSLLQSPRYSPMIDANRVGVFGFSIVGSQEERSEQARRLLQAPNASPDGRVRAILVMAPALGFLFDGSGLINVRVPVRLYRVEHDQILHHPHDGETYRRMLPVTPDTIVVSDAGHYVFLAPPPAILAKNLPDVFKDQKSFDRFAFHQRLNTETEEFFKTALG